MKSAFKYIILSLIAFILSIIIYEYITKSKDVYVEEDILSVQAKIDEKIFSDTNYTLENPKVILNPYGSSPLTALVIFQTKDLTSPTVTVKGKDEASTITSTFLPSKVHVLPIYGLYADYDNKVIIEASTLEKEITIKTEDVPSDLITIKDKNLEESTDLYFVNTNSYPCAFDHNGDLRWYLKTNYTWDITRLNNGHLLIGNNKLMKNPYYSSGLVELDLLGNIYYEYNIPNGYHHSVYEKNDGNLLLVSNNPDSNTTEDFIIEIDRSTGSIVKEFDFEKILNNLKRNNWLGIDSVWFDKKTNSITIAGSKNNTIVNVDYPSGEINYIVGDTDKKKYKINKTLSSPLSVSYIENSLIYYSDGKIFESKIKNKTIEDVFSYEIEESSNTNVSKTNQGYLISYNNYVKEINEDDEFYIEFSENISNVKKMPLYANDTFTKTNGIRLGEIGVTKTTNNYSVLFHKDGTQIMKKYNIDIYKDALRLIISGDFNKDDNVEIILDNVLDKKTYKMEINENGKSSLYINEDGVTGKYYIYLKINGKIYKTYKCVTLY